MTQVKSFDRLEDLNAFLKENSDVKIIDVKPYNMRDYSTNGTEWLPFDQWIMWVLVYAEDDIVGNKMYKSEAVHSVLGRGMVYVIDTNKYPNETIKLGDKINIDNIAGKVIGIESSHHSTLIEVVLRKDEQE